MGNPSPKKARLLGLFFLPYSHAKPVVAPPPFWHNAARMAHFNYRQVPAEVAPGQSRLAVWLADRPQMPYIIPFFAFVLLMTPSSFGQFAGIDWKSLWKQFHPEIYF